MVCSPLTYKGAFFGLITVIRKKSGQEAMALFNTEELDILGKIADSIAQSLRDISLNNEIKIEKK